MSRKHPYELNYKDFDEDPEHVSSKRDEFGLYYKKRTGITRNRTKKEKIHTKLAGSFKVQFDNGDIEKFIIDDDNVDIENNILSSSAPLALEVYKSEEGNTIVLPHGKALIIENNLNKVYKIKNNLYTSPKRKTFNGTITEETDTKTELDEYSEAIDELLTELDNEDNNKNGEDDINDLVTNDIKLESNNLESQNDKLIESLNNRRKAILESNNDNEIEVIENTNYSLTSEKINSYSTQDIAHPYADKVIRAISDRRRQLSEQNIDVEKNNEVLNAVDEDECITDNNEKQELEEEIEIDSNNALDNEMINNDKSTEETQVDNAWEIRKIATSKKYDSPQELLNAIKDYLPKKDTEQDNINKSYSLKADEITQDDLSKIKGIEKIDMLEDKKSDYLINGTNIIQDLPNTEALSYTKKNEDLPSKNKGKSINRWILIYSIVITIVVLILLLSSCTKKTTEHNKESIKKTPTSNLVTTSSSNTINKPSASSTKKNETSDKSANLKTTTSKTPAEKKETITTTKKQKFYTITYKKYDYTEGNVPSSQKVLEGESVKVKDNTLNRQENLGVVFLHYCLKDENCPDGAAGGYIYDKATSPKKVYTPVGWKTIYDTDCKYKNGSEITPAEDTTLLPCFKYDGEVLSAEFPNLKRDGYIFDGWYTGARCYGHKNPGYYYGSTNVTYWACWKKEDSEE